MIAIMFLAAGLLYAATSLYREHAAAPDGAVVDNRVTRVATAATVDTGLCAVVLSAVHMTSVVS